MSKIVEIQFGDDDLRISLPRDADVLPLAAEPAIPDPARAIAEALRDPLGSPPLSVIAREAFRRQGRRPQACVVVSDNTRPVPYRGPAGILEPILDTLRAEGVQDIEVLVATGTHRELAESELRRFLPNAAFTGGARVTCHVCADRGQLRRLGRTPRGTEVWINSRYLDADVRILTGLVEPHFMAGASGGPKSICPGIVGREVTHVFHGPDMMSHARALSLVLDGNPCHEESKAVAAMAGSDFVVNVTINRERAVTGVFAGEVNEVHRAAVRKLLASSTIRFGRPYDIIVTHAGFVGINHYQAAKAAVEASRAVRPGGRIILTANHTEVDPVGSTDYRRVLPMLRDLGVEGFERRIRAPDWTFAPDQWEVQMWGRVFRRLGALSHLTYCAPRLCGEDFRRAGVPGTDGGGDLVAAGDRDLAEAMVQRAVNRLVAAVPGARIGLLPDGPYGVPFLEMDNEGAV